MRLVAFDEFESDRLIYINLDKVRTFGGSMEKEWNKGEEMEVTTIFFDADDFVIVKHTVSDVLARFGLDA